jgi:hypothetical protein
MIYRLVTLDQVRIQLNYDGTYADAQLLFRLDSVSRSLMDYIGPSSVALAGWTDSNGDPLVDDNGDPLAEFLVVDSNGDPVLDTNGDRLYELAVAQVDSSGNYVDCRSVIPGQVQAATICAMAEWDDDRTGEVITPAVESLLRRTRDPAVI